MRLRDWGEGGAVSGDCGRVGESQGQGLKEWLKGRLPPGWGLLRRLRSSSRCAPRAQLKSGVCSLGDSYLGRFPAKGKALNADPASAPGPAGGWLMITNNS